MHCMNSEGNTFCTILMDSKLWVRFVLKSMLPTQYTKWVLILAHDSIHHGILDMGQLCKWMEFKKWEMVCANKSLLPLACNKLQVVLFSNQSEGNVKISHVYLLRYVFLFSVIYYCLHANRNVTLRGFSTWLLCYLNLNRYIFFFSEKKQISEPSLKG